MKQIMVYRYYVTPNEYERAKANGIPKETVDNRVRSLGWNVKDAITRPVRKLKKYRSYGKWKEMAISNNIPLDTFYARVNKYGWTKERASTQKVRCNSAWARNRKGVS